MVLLYTRLTFTEQEAEKISYKYLQGGKVYGWATNKWVQESRLLCCAARLDRTTAGWIVRVSTSEKELVQLAETAQLVAVFSC